MLMLVAFLVELEVRHDDLRLLSAEPVDSADQRTPA
jgi:hypothetical protein